MPLGVPGAQLQPIPGLRDSRTDSDARLNVSQRTPPAFLLRISCPRHLARPRLVPCAHSARTPALVCSGAVRGTSSSLRLLSACEFSWRIAFWLLCFVHGTMPLDRLTMCARGADALRSRLGRRISLHEDFKVSPILLEFNRHEDSRLVRHSIFT